MQHWSDPYIGTPYAQYDCAAMAALVQREVFGREISLPSDRAEGLRAQSRQLQDLQADYAQPVAQPIEGDAVLMRGRGRINHVGVYTVIGGVAYVLHAMKKPGHTCLHRLRDLHLYGLQVEGFYAWLIRA